ncbi:FAD-binding oxidoreductase [soil metagenome]
MILDRLRAIVGDAHVVAGDDVEPRYLLDETAGPQAIPSGLVRPADTAQVAAILSLCNDLRQPVVVQGGRTGMARGALPRAGELLLSLERLRVIERVDAVAGTMTVQAGVLLEVAQDAASEAGWQLAVDIGARGSCTIGGMIATNAGGHQVLRHGMMRDQVLGLEVVLADGTILSSLNRMLKNNAGYDLKHLFIGSEGTLGVVTRAVLRLHAPPIGRHVALCALDTYEHAIALLNRIERALPSRLSAFELMWDDFFDAACARIDRPSPFTSAYPLYALIELDSEDGDRLSQVLADRLDDGGIADAVISQSDRDHVRLWSYREAIGELMNAMTVVEPFDVSMPIDRIGTVVGAMRKALLAAIPGCQPLFFGHIADGNLHLALDLPDEAVRPLAETIVYDLVRDVGGSVSGEHGIGMLKRQWLAHSRTPEEIALMQRLRLTMDGNRILNPGRIFQSPD